MDSKIKFKILESNYISNKEIIVKLDNAKYGFSEKEVLKSTERNLFWETQNGAVLNFDEKRWYFENENLIENPKRKNWSIFQFIKTSFKKNTTKYEIKPIGHNEKPYINEQLVIHSTTFRKKIKIIDIYDEYFLLENEESYKGVIPKRKVIRNSTAKIGDFVRHCEHQFHDLVDENENFIYRQ